jgi:hypothetical protein
MGINRGGQMGRPPWLSFWGVTQNQFCSNDLTVNLLFYFILILLFDFS